MLPKSQRLTSSEVEDVMSKGRSILSDLFLVKFLKTDGLNIKVSALAPKKAFPTAVERNKIRRRVYSILAPLFNKKITKNSFLVAIIANKRMLNVKKEALSSEMEQVFIKGGIL